MPQQYSSQQEGQGQRLPAPGAHLATIALRGLSQLADMQIAVTRLMLQTQARAATSFGLPDYSDLFRVEGDRAKQLFASGAEQLLNAADHAGSTLSEVQRQVGRLVETQTVTLSETWQRGIEELGTQAGQGLETLSETTRRQVEEAERAVQEFSQKAQNGMQRASAEAEGEGGEEEGAEQGDGAEGGNGHSRRSRGSAGGRGARSR